MNIKLVFLILCALLVFILNIKSIYSIKSLNKRRTPYILFTRALLLVLIVIGVNGFSMESRSKTIHTVFVVDRSSSASNLKDDIELFINDSINRKTEDDRVSLLSFGADVSIDYTAFMDKKKTRLDTVINDGASNYKLALDRASSLIGNNEKGRIVLISDGYENQDDYNDILDELKLKNIDFKFLKLAFNEGEDSQISSMHMPKEVVVGEQFKIELEIHSSKASSAILRIYKNSNMFSEKQVRLSKGKNIFVYKDYLHESGNQIYSAEIDLMGDLVSKNNKYSSLITGIGKPSILIAGDGLGSEKYISSLAYDNGFKVDNFKADELPVELKNLLKYQAIILNNISLEETPSDFIKSLKTYVEDFGGGLFVSGGENSYALGGYYKTELEEILPVNMEMKRDKMLPSVSMLLIIDRSGSMDGEKIDMAKEAARKSVEAMKPGDSIGVLAFDDKRSWVSGFKSIEEKDDIIDSISSIGSGGGTAILPALKDGIDELKARNSKLKHIILLTDGQAETRGYDPIIEMAKDNQITISTIGLGSSSDIRLLKYIADKAAGRFYSVRNPRNIPMIFTKETFLASKSYINEEEFLPIVSSDSSIIYPLLREATSLNGYVSSSLKEGSSLMLKTNKDEPLLSSWYYGLGKVSAWTSDSGGKWSQNLLSLESGKRLFLNIINDLLLSSSNSDINISTSNNGSSVDILLGRGELSTALVQDEIILVDKDGKEKSFKGQVYNNEFVKLKLDNLEEGFYILKSSARLGDEIIGRSSPLVVNYSNEYNLVASEDVSEDMVSRLGGIFIEDSSQVFTKLDSKVYDRRDYTDLVIILAIIVLIIDIYIRRFSDNIFNKLYFKLRSNYKNLNLSKVENKTSGPTSPTNASNIKEYDKAGIRGGYVGDRKKVVKKKVNNKALNNSPKTGSKKDASGPGDMEHLNRLLKAKDKRK